MKAPTKRYRIAKRLYVEFSFDPDREKAWKAEWEPDVPYNLASGKLYSRYRAARTDYQRYIEAAIGEPMMMVDENGVTVTASPDGSGTVQ